MGADLRSVRRDYHFPELDPGTVPLEPFALLLDWLQQAIDFPEQEPTAMTLSTCIGNHPSARIVLLKELTHEGLVFFSNYRSRKGQELEMNPQASALFFWVGLARQVRLEGWVEKIDREISREYFDSRPLESRISAAVSPQSRVIDLNRSSLERSVEDYKRELGDAEPEMPAHWGGYLLHPEIVEFWQGRPNRLHDRLLYKLNTGAWSLERLAP